jgi:hypothetical protein
MKNFVTIIKLNILQLSNVTIMDIFECKYVTYYENGVTQVEHIHHQRWHYYVKSRAERRPLGGVARNI